MIERQDDFASTSIVIHNFSLLAWEKGIVAQDKRGTFFLVRQLLFVVLLGHSTRKGDHQANDLLTPVSTKTIG